jgi:hypothetical protein
MEAPSLYEDIVTEGVTVITVFDASSERWTTTVVGGPTDGWSTTYRDEADPVIQHAKVIEAIRSTRPTTVVKE